MADSTATALLPRDPELPFVPCTERGLDWFAEAPYSSRHPVELPVSPEVLFDTFRDPETWPRWVLGIQRVEWTSPEPYGPGTTRTVTFADGTKVYERFFDFEAPRTMGFSLYGLSQGIFESFAEHYEVVPTAAGCTFTWSVAYTPAGHLRWLHPWVRPGFLLAFRFYLWRLRRLLS